MSRMEGFFSAWGRILTGLPPEPVDRDHPRVPAALPWLLRLRRRSSRRRRHAARGRRLQGPGAGDSDAAARRRAQAAARLDRRRRAAGPLPRAEHAPADPGRARHPRAAGDQRGAADPGEWAQPAAPADRRLDRRPAARARRAAQAGDLRPHPEAHRRAPDHRPLHGHAAAGPAARAISKSSSSSGRRNDGHPEDLDQPVHAADRRGLREACRRPTASSVVASTCWRCGRAIRSSRCRKG